MNNSKHTPGPWHTKRVSGYHAVLDGDGTISPMTYGNDDDQAEANARLIAAAPELLEALQGCIGYIQSNVDNDPDLAEDADTLNALKEASSAIAKATGQQ